MNPEAVEWLENLDEADHVKMFAPVYPFTAEIFSLKDIHEGERCNGRCYMCREAEELVVIE